MDQERLERLRERLGDRVRMEAYREAIRRVCKGKVVCELGAGIGELGLMALEAGASRVYAIEPDPEALELAEAIVARNGFGAASYQPIPGRSYYVDLPERADVVLSDLFSPIGLGAEAHFALEDARHRHAKPDAVFLPRGMRRQVALARPRVFARECEFWDADLFLAENLDFGDVLGAVRGRERRLKIRPDELASDWQELPELAFADRASYGQTTRAQLGVLKPGSVTGFCVTFEIDLAEGIRLGTQVGEAFTRFDQGFHPLGTPLSCGEGDLVDLELIRAREPTPSLGAGLQVTLQHVPAPRVDAFLEANEQAA